MIRIPWSALREHPRLAAWPLLLALVVCLYASAAHGMTDDELREKRQDTVDLFYHGFDNYMEHAFPEDELKPLSCQPLTRDRENPAHIEVNDVLGNYSLTLIDTLSTLAILASSPEPLRNGREPWIDFQKGIEALVDLYGDGTARASGHGNRAKGFDVDSKVQVFETVIRGVGGLLSAHLFASGELPVIDRQQGRKRPATGGKAEHRRDIRSSWVGQFRYDGQLLRLAIDLADRLVPAFYTATGLPYPRVNLRRGVPFYMNSPLNVDSEHGICDKNPPPIEITETCTAGAGSLVLEFTTLSRLTGDDRYERLANRAFWAVWERRSELDLLGAGVDAETGLWVSSYAGIGAGIDSFFEYALKSHILLSRSTIPFATNASQTFLSVWQNAHAGVKRHLYRGDGYQHPHYIQGDLYTGASKAYWLDSLSAFYPGLLALGGEIDEAVETHLLYTALWTRYAALPERWSTASGNIDAGLRWWGGRPEFIESTWYLYRATQDPYYLHVGEMTLQDIRRRCWTRCGWAGLEDVRTGELKDRMESFFLGETAKYLYLLFDPDHPLNKLDAPFVFTTEGHPLILPQAQHSDFKPSIGLRIQNTLSDIMPAATCKAAPSRLPFSISAVASRPDLFHAAGLARLHQIDSGIETNDPVNLVESSYNAVTYAETVLKSPNNYTFYPWTLPSHYIPTNGTSSRMKTMETFDLVFPTFPNTPPGQLLVSKVDEGVVINTVSGLKLSMLREQEFMDNQSTGVYRIHSVGALLLGKDERVFLATETASQLNPTDPYLTRHRDLGMIELVLDLAPDQTPMTDSAYDDDDDSMTFAQTNDPMTVDDMKNVLAKSPNTTTTSTAAEQQQPQNVFNALMQHLQQAFEAGTADGNPIGNLIQSAQQQLQQQLLPLGNINAQADKPSRRALSASTATGPGAAPVPSVPDAAFDTEVQNEGTFWSHIHLANSTMCDRSDPLPVSVAHKSQVLVMKRGECSFSSKLRNIPSFAPSATSLQLAIIVSYPEHDARDAEAASESDDDTQHATSRASLEGGTLIRPYLDEEQLTPGGMKRVHGIPMVMVDGGDETWQLLQNTKRLGIRRRYWYESQGTRISNLIVI